MIRIKPGKCGYSGYTCSGIPKLKIFDPADIYWRDRKRIESLDGEFSKLPTKVKGMVFVADTIDMDWGAENPPEVPELSCRSDLDPFSDSEDPSEHMTSIPVNVGGTTVAYPVYGSTGGFIDLFNKSDYKDRVWFDIDGTTYGRIWNVEELPSFVDVSTNTELMLEPGWLEPMLDTDFKPISIDTITNIEASIDGLGFSFVNLNNWKGQINSRINNLYAVINGGYIGGDDTNLRELKNAEYEQSDCNNFQITLTTGSAVQEYGHQVQNTYSVSGGDVNVDGEEHTIVEGLTGCTAPFYAYLAVTQEHNESFSDTTLPAGYTVGTVMDDGGTIVNIEEITDPETQQTTYAWTAVYPQSIEIRSAAAAPLPMKGYVGIGGVNIISGGTNSDSYVLYKIFQEDCITSVNIGDDAAEVNTHYPPPTSEYNAPDYKPGIVYPYDNIVHGTTAGQPIEGSTETTTGWGHSAYVPTVNATYEFVHNNTYGTDDNMADTQALAHRYVPNGAIVSADPAEYLTYPHTADDITFSAIEVDQATGISDMLSGATAAVDAAEAAVEAATTEEELEEAQAELAAAQTALLEANTFAEGHTASLAGGTPGTANIITAIVVSGGAVVTPGPTPDVAVPTAAAVDVYVHGEYALAQFGYVARTTNPTTSSVVHRAPGTVLTVDEVDTALYEAGEYFYDDVPTIRAMVKYVDEHGGTDASIADINHTYPPGTEQHPGPEGTAGIVYVYDNIISGATTTESWGGSAYVPSVNGVFDFVHTDITGDTAARALATGATVTNPVGVNYDYQNKTGINPLHIKTITKDKKQTDYWDNIAGGTVYQTTITGTTPGTVIAIDQIVWSNGSVVGTIDKQVNVPNTMAVYSFVHGIYALAEPGYVDPKAATVSGHVYSGVVHGTPGTVLTVSEINDDVFNGGAPLNYYWEEVPTVYAVVEYVATKGATTATAGYIDITGSGANETDSTQNIVIPSGTAGVPDTVIQAMPGYVQPVHNIKLHGTPSKRSASPVDVPTVEAVYNFVHSLSGSTNYKDDFDFPMSDARADVVGTTITASGSTSAALVAAAKPGTFYVTNDFTVMGGTVTDYTDPQAVPTALAVYKYIQAKVVSMTESVVGILGTTSASPYEYIQDITGSTHAAGSIQPVVNILVNGNTAQRPESHNDVPTVEAVWNFIHGYTISGTTQSTALATIGTITGTTTGSDPTITGTTFTGGVPGTFDVTGTIVATADKHSVTNVVPTAEAVVRYIASLPEVAINDAVPGTITIKNSQEAWWIETITGGTVDHTAVRGIVDETDVVIVAGTHGLSSVTVPTTEAVYNFIHDIAVTGKTPSSAYATVAGTTVTTVGGSTAAIVTTAIPGTFLVTDDIRVLGTTVTTWSGKEAVPTALAVAEYVRQYIVGGATAGTLDVTGSTTEYWSSVSPAKTPVPGYVYTTTAIVVGDTPSISLYAVPTAKAVNDFVAGYTASVGGFSVTAADKEDWETTGTPVTQRKADPGIVGVVDTLVAAATVSNRSLSVKTVPTVAAVKDYVDTHVPDMAVSGDLNAAGDWVTAATVSAGIFYVATNVVGGTADSDAYASVPTVHAVHSFVSGYTATIGGFTVTSNDDEDWITDYEAAPGIISVVDTIDAAEDEDNRSLSISTVPTVAAVKDYVDAVGGGMLFPNIEALGNVSGSPGPGQGVTFLVPVKKGWTIGVDYGGGVSVCAVYAPSDGTTTTPSDCSSDFPVPDDGYARVSVIDSGTTDGCVRFMKGNYRLPLYKSGNMRATGSSVITVSEGAENVTGSPGRCYISNGVNFGGDKAYSKITAPSVEAVYDFIHGTTAAGVEMLSALADIAGSTITGTTALALVSTAKPGTVYVTDDFTLLGGTVTTYNDPQAVPTVLAVRSYINGLNLGPAVPGTLEATASSEAWDDEDTAVSGTVLVSKNVTVSTTGNTISTVAVPTVDAVNTFVSSYTASPGTINVPSSGDETWSTASVAGIVKVANNVDAAGTQANRKVSETAVPTVYAVKTYVDNHTDSYTGDFHLIGGSTIAVGTAYYPGGSKSTVQTAISSISGYNNAKIIWLKIYRTSASATINAAFTTSYTRDIYTQCVPIVGRGSTSGSWEQWQRGPVIIEGRWE